MSTGDPCGRVSDAARSAVVSSLTLGDFSAKHCPPPSRPFPGLPFPVGSPAVAFLLILLPRHKPLPPPTPAGLRSPDPPPSLPPHLKPPAPRWAPPCGNCPWRGRDGEPSETWAGAAAVSAAAATAAAGSPQQPARPAAPSLSHHPPRRPSRPQPRRKCGRGGRGPHSERGSNAREPPQSTRFISRGSGAWAQALNLHRRHPSAPTGRLDNNLPTLPRLPAPIFQEPAQEPDCGGPHLRCETLGESLTAA